MPFADVERYVTEKFNIERDRQQAQFLRQTASTAAQHSQRGILLSGVYLQAATDEHCAQLRLRAETLKKCILTVLDAAKQPVLDSNINSILDYINRVLDLQFTELSVGIGTIATVLPQMTGGNMFKIEIEKCLAGEKRKAKNDLEIIVLANKNNNSAAGSSSTNIINYGHIVGIQTGANSAFTQNFTHENAAELVGLIEHIKSEMSSIRTAGIDDKVKQEIIEAADTIAQQVKSDSKNKYTIMGAISTLGKWAGRIDVITEAYDKIRGLFAAYGF